MVQNLKRDFTAIRGCPCILKLCIASRHHGEEVTNRRVHDVAEAAAPVFIPFLLEIARRNTDLVGIRANRTRKLDPVRLCGEVAAITRTCSCRQRHLLLRGKFLAATLGIIRDLSIRVVANHRHRHRQERAVLNDLRILLSVAKAPTRVAKGEANCQLSASWQRLAKTEHMHAKVTLVAGFCPRTVRRQDDLIQAIRVRDHHFAYCHIMGVLEDKLAFGDVLAFLRH